MSKIQYHHYSIDCLASETVLDALLRSELDVPYSCKTGTCQTCLMRAVSGNIPAAAQTGLKDTLIAQGYFLPCSCRPETDLVIAPPNEADIYAPAKILEKEFLAKDILQLTIEPAIDMYYHAGQFINLRRSDGLARSYSIASLPQADRFIELHVKRMKNGIMSNWLFDQLEAGQYIDIQGPLGKSFYLAGKENRKMLLIGTGTGLAPLIGITRDALLNGHQGDIYLYHGSRHHSGFYKHKTLSNLESNFSNFHYYPCTSKEPINEIAGHEILSGRANELALSRHSSLKDWLVYLCGIPQMVNSSKKHAYLAGANLCDIYADPFDFKDLRKNPR